MHFVAVRHQKFRVSNEITYAIYNLAWAQRSLQNLPYRLSSTTACAITCRPLRALQLHSTKHHDQVSAMMFRYLAVLLVEERQAEQILLPTIPSHNLAENSDNQQKPISCLRRLVQSQVQLLGPMFVARPLYQAS